ncbi:MAG: JAB domain-containing protein, partial [Candidatus Omnitrophica bacterium]|nr:JAB domain-containing protein [Candidatus Omnitrophota bacterium]
SKRLIDMEDTATGTVNHAMPLVREIIHSALQKFAVSIICVHNHPSGSIMPSMHDKRFTQELSSASQLMNIKFLDHVIVGDDTYFSFEESNLV